MGGEKMASALSLIGDMFLLVGIVFFVAALIGYLRFSALLTRLHAVSKADNVGLGLVMTGLALKSGDIYFAIKCLLIWVLMLAASAAVSYGLANKAIQQTVQAQDDSVSPLAGDKS